MNNTISHVSDAFPEVQSVSKEKEDFDEPHEPEYCTISGSVPQSRSARAVVLSDFGFAALVKLWRDFVIPDAVGDTDLQFCHCTLRAAYRLQKHTGRVTQSARGNELADKFHFSGFGAGFVVA